MDTLKTAVVVVLLLAVLYGVYVVLNKPTESLPLVAPWKSEQMPALEVDLGSSANQAVAELASTGLAEPPSVSPWPMPASMPSSSQPETVPESPLAEKVADLSPPVSAPDLLSNTGPSPPPEQVSATEPVGQSWPSSSADTATLLPGKEVLPEEFAAADSDPVGELDPVDLSPPASGGGDEDEVVERSSEYARLVGNQLPNGSTPGSYSPFEAAIQSASAKVESEQWHDALWTLSLFYGNAELDAEQQQLLQDWLDPLAAKVIYSQEHLIEKPYTVQPTDTLQSVAESHRVPWQLLANINGLQDTPDLTAGSTLKVVPGPMRAEVDLTRNLLTVFVGKLYAGQFPVAAGQDPAPKPGEYQIQEKLPGRTYYAGDGQTIPPEDPANPFGRVWLDLGNEVCIHGSAPSRSPDDRRGCISLSPRDANDLYGILSKGSSVSILR